MVSVLEEANFDPAEIATIFRGEHPTPLYNGLIHSSLDLDRMDYLVGRDSLATGVPFGHIDLEYLLTHLDADKEGLLGLLEKAATAAEHFMLARYFMTKVVYFHKTVFAFETFLRQILYLLRREGLLWPDGDAVRRVVSDDKEFAKFCDGHIDALIDGQSHREDLVGLLCRSLRLRRPPMLLKEMRTVFRTKSQSRRSPTSSPGARTRPHSLAKRHGVEIGQFLWEDPKDESFEKLGPYSPIGKTIDPSETDEFLRIVKPDGTKHPADRKRLPSGPSPLVAQIQDGSTLSRKHPEPPLPPEKIETIRQEVDGWLR